MRNFACRLGSCDYRKIQPHSVAFCAFVLWLAGASGGMLHGQSDCEGEWREWAVTDAGSATQTALGVDLANNAYIASVVDEAVQIEIINTNLQTSVGLSGGGSGGQGDPDFATNSLGVTFMTFGQPEHGSIFAEGREVFLGDNAGGRFTRPFNISNNRVDDYAPRIALDRKGRPHVVWSQRLGDEIRVMYWNEGLFVPEFVALGDYPAIFLDQSSTVHIVYSRDNDLFYTNNDNARRGFFTETRVLNTPDTAESSVSIGVDPDYNVFVAYESRNTLYFAGLRNSEQTFRTPRLLDTGGVFAPKMRMRQDGKLAIVYTKKGDLFHIIGRSNTLNLPPRRIFATPQVESRPSLDVDIFGTIHISFIREGKVYYINNGCAPTVDFSVSPASGEAPLVVQFSDLSSGNIKVWEWDFGDGTGSSLANPQHLYPEPGRYDVRLTVSAVGGRTSTVQKEDAVFVQTPLNTMSIPDQVVLPGQVDVWFPVLATHENPIQGFQVMGTFDPNVLIPKGYSLEFTSTQAVAPEFLDVNVFDTRIEIGSIFDFDSPFENKRLPPSDGRSIINLIFDVAASAPQGAATELTLLNNRELSRIFNIFTVEGFSVLPALRSSTIEVLPLEFPLPRLFVRGDVDGNREVEISDAVKLLNYLFLGGVEPRCFDAADFDDVGRVTITSGISLLNFLFLGGSPPAVPFPTLGVDPTPDDIPPCN